MVYTSYLLSFNFASWSSVEGQSVQSADHHEVVDKPVNVPTRATVDFITAQVPSPASIIEVGCGEGHVALDLQNRGYQIIGLDLDEKAIAQALGRGAPVVRAAWVTFSSSLVDAVVFTRSLHHNTKFLLIRCLKLCCHLLFRTSGRDTLGLPRPVTGLLQQLENGEFNDLHGAMPAPPDC